MLPIQTLTNAQADLTNVGPVLMVVIVETPLVHMSVLVQLDTLVMEYSQEKHSKTMKKARVVVSV